LVDFRERLPEYGCSRRFGIAASAISDERAVSIEVGLDVDSAGVAGAAAVPGDVAPLVGGVVPLVGGAVPLVGGVVPLVCELGWVADEAITVPVGTDGGADGGVELAAAFVVDDAGNGWARIVTIAASKLVTVCTA
jgi:hypothetical protein